MRLSLALVLVLAAAAATATAPATAADVNLNVYPIAGRSMHDSDFWDPVDDQYALGGTVDFGRATSPLHFALGLHGSVGDEDILNPLVNKETANINELSFGIAKVWTTQGSVRPFVSGGLSFVHAELEFDNNFGSGTVNDDDDSIGVWIEGGVYWRLTAHFNLGLFGRGLMGTSINLFGEDTDADYFEAGPMIGWSWPPKK